MRGFRIPVPVVFAAVVVGASSCAPSRTDEMARVEGIARAIAAACPFAPADDAARWRECSDRLTAMPALRDGMVEPFLWGQQGRLWDYRLEAFNTTRFNPLVWRKMYLSLFMFSGQVTVETSGDLVVAHLPYLFRNGLEPGLYPYPFWHNPAKWRDYQLATELLLVFRDGRMVGALRSAVRLLERGATQRTWDGRWQWDGGAEPRVTLYENLFARSNPHIARVDATFRALESAFRPYACFACHSPDNGGHANPLELFSYPNQALVARHAIREQIERGLMPPATDTSGAGIPEASERAELLRLARAFELAADDALAAEGEPVDAGRPDAAADR